MMTGSTTCKTSPKNPQILQKAGLDLAVAVIDSLSGRYEPELQALTDRVRAAYAALTKALDCDALLVVEGGVAVAQVLGAAPEGLQAALAAYDVAVAASQPARRSWAPVAAVGLVGAGLLGVVGLVAWQRPRRKMWYQD